MDVSELMPATVLVGQYNQVSAAISLFYQEGTIITAVTFTGAEPTAGIGTVVDTRAYSFPQEVIDGLEAMLWSQLQDLANQLTALGVTGLTQPKDQRRKK